MKNKRLWVSVLAGILAALMLLTLLAGIIPKRGNAAGLSSQLSEELKKKIKDMKEQQDVIQEEIDALDQQIDANMSEMEAIILEKNSLDQQIGLMNQQILLINEQIAAYGLLIADKQDELDATQARYDQLVEENRERIRIMEEQGSISYWSVLFEANSFSDLLDRMNMIKEINDADKLRLEEMAAVAEEVAAAQADLEAEKAELEATKKTLADLQADLTVKRAEADEILVKLNAKGEAIQALLDEAEAAEEALIAQIAAEEKKYNAEINRLEEEERKRREEEERKKQEAAQGGSAPSTGTSVPSSATWLLPCSYIYLSSPYGYRIHPVYGDWRFHSGVDLAAPRGTSIYATRGGTVTAATYNSSAGYYVTINHGDGFSSSYLHMTHFVVNVGDRVSAGQKIGEVGSTGTSTGNHLHFSIYYNGATQNPADYIRFY